MIHCNAVFSMTNMWDMHALDGWKVIFQIKSQSVRFHFKTCSPEPKLDNAVSISVFAAKP